MTMTWLQAEILRIDSALVQLQFKALFD
uniref:Poly-beta-hydroxybutyrate polymerase (Poly(3-hydroxybutyrate) polymerase) (PHB polymerase) (PHB synthase) (Poly(3-hydroxyalkanoate) polymerase) (PHA polymerase) (PHA synthase) (Polyhydroxyalkanoic... n=1 Tax=mine drainage metagenome TaxID=410659 RepID=E6QTA2_9ZZZZ